MAWKRAKLIKGGVSVMGDWPDVWRREAGAGGVMADDIKPGSDGRPAGCFYFKEDHERAAAHVRERAPEVFEWIKAHPEGLPDDIDMHQLMWTTAMQILPKASLIDHANVALELRLQARPLTEREQRRVADALRRSAEWHRRRNN